jgi:DNA polymerase kappa
MARIDPQSAGPSSSGLKVLSLNMTKAGMEGLDKDKINAIVAEASKGSKFYEAKLKNQVKDISESITL